MLLCLDSETRTASILGLITGGGLGPLIPQTIRTRKDREAVSLYILLAVLMDILMDWVSGWLRGLAARAADRPEGLTWHD